MRVKDQYRKNELSTSPGGDEVFVYYTDGLRIYDKVKSPHSYANVILAQIRKGENENITKIEIKDKIIWEKS
jgi:hypothetical protein